MSFSPSSQLVQASRKESAYLELFTASCAEFRALVQAEQMVDSEGARELAHKRLDAYFDAFAATIAIARRDVDKGI